MAVEQTLTNFVTLDLLTWREQGTLQLSPKFQRRPVWKPAAKSYFIDTLLRGFPVPPIHVRLTHRATRGAVREIVDGQQRLRALFDFIEGKYKLGRQLDATWSGKTFDQLLQAERDRLLMYQFHVYQYQNVDDATILQIFARINTYSVALNKQELRNGRYFGYFKNLVYSLAFEHLQFWRLSHLFTEGAIARMQEAELTSELLVLQMDGLQDKKSSLDDFYARLDEEWPSNPHPWQARGLERPNIWLSRDEAARRFRETIQVIVDAVSDVLPNSEFSRVPLFYTLYAAVYHHLFGLPSCELQTPASPLTPDRVRSLRMAVEELSLLLGEKPSAEELSGWQRDFVVASARQTDNLRPRQTRLLILWQRAELASP